MKKELFTIYIVHNEKECEVRSFTETTTHGLKVQLDKDQKVVIQGMINALNRTLTLIKKYGEEAASVKIKNVNTDRKVLDEEWMEFPVVQLKDFSELET